MSRVPHRVLRIATCVLVAVGSLGVTAAAADDPPTSTPDVYVPTVNANVPRNSGADGTGVTVAIIDTGVADVPGLHGRVIHQENISAAPAEGDQFGHGTFVAGLVHEVAPGAQIVSVKLSGADGSVDVTQVLAALQWVVVNKDRFSIDVVNLSFGNDSKQSAHTSPLNFAVQQVWDAGIVVVASAGNLGDGSGTVTKPGDDPLAISVGAIDDRGTATRDDDVIPAYGSRGPTQDGLAKPDLTASGTRVVSLRAPGSTADLEHPEARVGDHHFRGTGTSFAAPIVAGVVAQMLSAEPTLEPDQVKWGLMQTAELPLGDPSAAGAGTVRAHKALEAARTGRANGSVRRSTGRGSLEGARGSAVVKVKAPVKLLGGTIVEVDIRVRGDHTAEVATDPAAPSLLELGGVLDEAVDGFDAGSFIDGSAWDASQWGASQWGASQWGASQWGASQWGASQWGASQWGSSQWWASQWG